MKTPAPAANTATTPAARPARVAPSDAPKNGATEVRTVNGVEQKYCTICLKWYSGKKAHVTKDHVKGKFKVKAAASANLSMAEISSLTVQEALDSINLHHATAPTVAPPTKPVTTMATTIKAKTATLPTGRLTMQPGLMCSVIDTDNNNPNFDFGDVDEDDILFFDSSCVPSDALYAEINYHDDEVSSINNDESFYDCYSVLPEEETKTTQPSTVTLKHSIPILFCTFIFPLATLMCALWFDYRRTMLGILLLIICASYKWCLITFINFLVTTKAVQSGPLKKWDSFAYPSHLLILSCVMLKQQFVTMMSAGTTKYYTFKKNKSIIQCK